MPGSNIIPKTLYSEIFRFFLSMRKNMTVNNSTDATTNSLHMQSYYYLPLDARQRGLSR